MRKEIKHHIYTADLYEHSGGILEYTIEGLDIYIKRTSVAFFSEFSVHPDDLPHLFELINICISELNQKTNQ